MSDLELMELAAKAAGYKKYYAHYLGRDSFVTYDSEYYLDVKERRVIGEKTLDWNPLTDDGDALRLAVKLAMYVALDNAAREVIACAAEGDIVKEWCGDDAYAATRRAIVRAAAEIGRQMGDGNAE